MYKFLHLVLLILCSFSFGLTFEESIASAKKNNKLLESINLDYQLNSLNFASQIFGSTLRETGSVAHGIIPQVRLKKVLLVDDYLRYQSKAPFPHKFTERIRNLNYRQIINEMRKEGLPLEVEVSWTTRSIKEMLHDVPKIHKMRQDIHQQEQKILLQIIASYFSALSALKSVELSHLQYEYNKQIYNSYKQKSDLGAVSKIELNLAYCHMLSSEQKYQKEVYKKEHVFADFKKNFGIDPCNLKLPTKNLVKFDKLNELKELALKKNYDLQSYEKMQFAYRGLLMSHLVVADIDLSLRHTLDGLPKMHNHELEVSLSLPINPNTIVDLIKIRTLLKKNAIDAQYHRESMLLELDAAWGDWNMCKAEFEANKELRKAKKDMVSMNKRRHDLGGVSIDEVIKSESELAKADMDLYNSISNLWIEYFKLIKLSGMLNFDYLLKNTKNNTNDDSEDEVALTSRLVVI